MKILKNQNFPLYIIFLIFAIDLSTYFATELIPVSAMKVVVCLLAIYLMYSYKSRVYGVGFKRLTVWHMLIVYMLMLSLRLFVDFIVPWKGFFLYSSPVTILFFFVVTILVPMFFFGNSGVKIDSMKWSIITGTFLCICLAVSFRNNLSGLAVTTLSGQHQGEGTVDIISYGHYGCTLILMGLYIYLEGVKKSRLWLSALFVVIGFSAVVLSGSRSPIIALVLCGILLYASRAKKTYALFFYGVLFFVLMTLLSTYIFQFNNYLQSRGIMSFNRIVDSMMMDDGVGDINTSGRDYLFNWGWQLFSENILLGTSYLLPDQSYVHNIFIEQFMALGIFGGTLFVIINIIILKYCWYLLKNHPYDSIYPVLFIQYMIFGFFSRTIIALIPYWLYMFVTLSIYSSYKKTSYGISCYSNIQGSRRLV